MVNKDDDERRRVGIGLLFLAMLIGTIALALAIVYGVTNGQSISVLERDVIAIEDKTTEMMMNMTDLQEEIPEIVSNVTNLQDQTAGMIVNVTELQDKTTAMMMNVTDLQNRTTYLEETVETLITNTTQLQDTVDTLVTNTTYLLNLVDTLTTAAPIHGWMLFWWQDPSYGNKNSWARFNETTGVMMGDRVPYSPSEARQGSPPGKSQFSRGPNPNDMIYLVWPEQTLAQYLVRHNPAAGTYLQTYLGSNPANHGPAFIVDYDPLNARYIAVSWSTIQSFAHCLVIIDENTGAITPLSGAGGTLAPAPMNNVLDMEVIGGYVLIFERYDDDYANPVGLTNRILFYNSTDGQYMSQSFHNGTYAAYPGSILSSNLQNLPTGYHVRWFVAASYDPATFRLHVVLGVSSAGYQREVGWIQGSSEANLLTQLLSGNYVINAVQHQNPYQLNAGVFLTPAPLAKK